jgi:hypothetical protein
MSEQENRRRAEFDKLDEQLVFERKARRDLQ